MPVTTFAAFVRRFAKDSRARLFFLDFKVPPDLPDLVHPMFQHAVQTLRQDGALSKAVFLTPHADIFSGSTMRRSAGTTQRVSAWKWSSTWKGRKSSCGKSGRQRCATTRRQTRASPSGACQ